MLEFLALGMVLEEALTGYDIKKRMETGIGTFYKASYGSLYPALKKLEAQGLLTTSDMPQGGRRRIVYRITAEGERRFYDWLTEPVDILDGPNAQLAKIYFFDKLPGAVRERQLLEYEIRHTNYLKKLRKLEREFLCVEGRDGFYYKLSTLYYGICVTRQTITWCRHIRERRPLSALTAGEEPPL